MRTYKIGQTDLEVSRLAYGCMKIGGRWNDDVLSGDEIDAAVRVVLAAYQAGITLFDHADIYTRGKSELAFAEALRAEPGMRDRIVLQTKCGIRFDGDPTPDAPARYDFSYEHIVSSVEKSLRRLGTDRIDILLLHRPDPLGEPQEVARAFDALHHAGKVRYFGVSNHTPGQIALLQAALDQPLVVNQVELSLLHHYLISEGIIANQEGGATALGMGILDDCRLRGILIQAWGPVAGGAILDPPPDAPPNVHETAGRISALAAEKGVPPEAVALAWLLRHPAPIQPIIGTIKPERVAASALADDVVLTREEWYGLLAAARGASVP